MLFSYKHKKSDDHSVLITLNIDSDEVSSEYNTQAKKIAQQISIPGFRKGKVPVSIAVSKASEEIIEKTVLALVYNASQDVIEKEKFDVYGQPSLVGQDFKSFSPDKPLKVQVSCFLTPSCKINNYDGLETNGDEVAISEDDIEKTYTQIMRSYGKIEEVKDKIVENDIIEISATFENEKHSKANLSHHVFYFGAGPEETYPPFLTHFRSDFLGKKSGESFESKKKIEKSKDEDSPFLKNEKVKVQFVIHNVKRMVLPKFDEELQKKIGFSNEESFKKHIKDTLADNAEKILKDISIRTVIERQKKNCQFGIPSLAVDYVVGHYWEQHLQRNVDKKDWEKTKPNEQWLENARKKAKTEVENQLLITEIIKSVPVTNCSNDDIDNEKKRILEEAKKDKSFEDAKKLDALKEKMNTEQTTTNIKNQLEHHKAIEYLLNQAKESKGKKLSYKQVVELEKSTPAG